MRLVLASEPDHVGEWVYPGSWHDLETPAEHCLVTELIDRRAFASLWQVLDSEAPLDETLRGENLPAAGYPHYGPNTYDEVNSALLDSLLAVPAHERWRTAQAWARALSGRPPNKERLAAFKQLLNQLCDLAARRDQHMLAVLPLR